LVEQLKNLEFKLANEILLTACSNDLLSMAFLSQFCFARADFIPHLDFSGKELSIAKFQLIGSK